MPTQSFSFASISNPFRQAATPSQESNGLRALLTGALDVLIVEDDDPVRQACADMAESLGCRVRTAGSVPAARLALDQAKFDVVFLDVRLPGGSGEVLLREVRSACPHAFVVMMTAFATVNSAVDLMRNGAGEFLQKPFALRQIGEVLQTAARRRTDMQSRRVLGEQLASGLAPGRLVGASEAMQKIFRMVAKVAHARHPVLIVGERGTGKEALARTIHANGPNPVTPFVPVDCDSLQSSRLELELFGGASAGRADSPGLLERAGNGTLYLSEIGCLEAQAQARLVRALSDRVIRSSATGDAVPLQARILASSSRDLQPQVEAGRFRKDLFYRLNVVTLRVPALRERAEDIPLLAELFLERERQAQGIPFTLAEEVLESMLQYSWAGNVEELEGLIERACGLSSNALIHFGDLSTQVKAFVHEVPSTVEESAPVETNEFIPIQELERRAIQDALRRLKGDKVLVAKCLGIGKTTLYRKLKDYNLAADEERSC